MYDGYPLSPIQSSIAKGERKNSCQCTKMKLSIPSPVEKVSRLFLYISRPIFRDRYFETNCEAHIHSTQLQPAASIHEWEPNAAKTIIYVISKAIAMVKQRCYCSACMQSVKDTENLLKY